MFGITDLQVFPDNIPGNGNGVSIGTSDVQLWGLGVVQEIDAAAMSIWLSYRHIEATINSGAECHRLSYDDVPVREGWRAHQLLIARSSISLSLEPPW